MIKPKDQTMRRYFNVEVEKTTAEKFKQVLRSRKIPFEPSQADTLIHFEIFCTPEMAVALDAELAVL